MELIKAILMGLLQGMMEFMPVSSTGHLALADRMFQSESGMEMVFVCMLHMASLIAILVVFVKDIANLAVAFCGIIVDIVANFFLFIKRLLGRKTEGYYIINSSPHRKFLILLTETSVVTAVVGLGMRMIARGLMNNLVMMGVCFIINGILLYISDWIPKGNKKIKNSNDFDAIIIGAVQGFTVLPGLSRMGLSMTSAMALGMEKSFAVKYSLISSVPVILGSFILELTAVGGNSFQMGLIADYLISMAVAAVVAIISIRIIIGIIKKYPMIGFAIYSGVIGVIAIFCGLVK